MNIEQAKTLRSRIKGLIGEELADLLCYEVDQKIDVLEFAQADRDAITEQERAELKDDEYFIADADFEEAENDLTDELETFCDKLQTLIGKFARIDVIATDAINSEESDPAEYAPDEVEGDVSGMISDEALASP